MKKTLAAALLLGCSVAAYAAPVKQHVLEKDTEVLVTVLDRLTPKTVKAGDTVLFSVAYPVKDKDRDVVIAQSADAWGTIVKVPETKAVRPEEIDWKRPDRKGQLARERYREDKNRTVDKNWGTLGITIDRATMVTGKDVDLIADVAREDSHTMITLDRKAYFDPEAAKLAAELDNRGKRKRSDPNEAVSRDITLAIPWSVFTTGTLSVVEPGTVLRARVLADTVVSEDPQPEVKKPTPKPARRPRRPRVKAKPKLRCPCCFLCDCVQRTGKPCPAASKRPCKPAPVKPGCTCQQVTNNCTCQKPTPNCSCKQVTNNCTCQQAPQNPPQNTPAPNAPNNAVQNVPANPPAPKEPEVKPLSGTKPFSGATVTDISGEEMPMI